MRYRLATACGAILVFLGVLPLLGDTTAVVRSATCVQVRVGPRANARSIDCIAPDTAVRITASSPYWRRVAYRARQGWVAKKYLRLTSAAPRGTEEQWLEIHIIDVGQGDGIWIHTPDDGAANGSFEGKNIIIDGGPDRSDANNALLTYVRKLAHEGAVIDTLIITHPHADHYRGAIGILQHYDVTTILDAGYPKGGTEYLAFKEKLRTKEGATALFGAGEFRRLRWGDELTAEILYAYGTPGVELGTKDNTKENNSSIVLRLQYGEHSFLFMGDAEGKERDGSVTDAEYVEKFLLQTPDRLKATVLKIAHHGSETSSTIPFIAAVDPEILIVSSARKDFGRNDRHVFLPDDSTLERYCCHNPPCVSTAPTKTTKRKAARKSMTRTVITWSFARMAKQ